MKVNKSILAAALCLSVAGLADAATVYITGSTAGRAAAYDAFTTAGVVFSAVPTITTYGNADATKAGLMVFEGNITGVGATTVSCKWSGSEAGVSDVAASPQVAVSGFVGPASYNAAVNSGAPATTESSVVDVAFADAKQEEAAIYGNNPTPPPAITTFAKLGVIPFKLVRNAGLWTGNNVTSSMIRQALGGLCPRSVFTGVAGQTDRVYVLGRDNSSGTRVNFLGDTGFGIFANVNQIKIDAAGVMLNNPTTKKGNGGESSGGTLATRMRVATSTLADTARIPNTTGFSMISYMGFDDAGVAIASPGGAGTPATELTYNGVPYSNANIIEGTYTYWGNWHVFAKNSAGTAALAVYNAVAANVANTFDGTTIIKLTDMHSTRSGASSDVVHN